MKYVRKGSVEAVKVIKGEDKYKALTGDDEVAIHDEGITVYYGDNDVSCHWGQYLIKEDEELYSMYAQQFEERYELAPSEMGQAAVQPVK
jgi:hypothetical protein